MAPGGFYIRSPFATSDGDDLGETAVFLPAVRGPIAGPVADPVAQAAEDDSRGRRPSSALMSKDRRTLGLYLASNKSLHRSFPDNQLLGCVFTDLCVCVCV